MNQKPSLAGRAVLAVLLMIGFYALALGLIALLVGIPLAEWNLAGRLHIKLALFCGFGALVIFWSILPRFDRFRAPGKRLTRESQPELFREIDMIASRTGQAAPAEVYLDLEMNAWVANRGGLMGVGSRRVMCLGLPLMQALTVEEFRGVLAHEFGHFYGGDTRLAPWVYKTRAAIMRTLDNLSQHSGLLQAPFVGYAKMFLKITQSISRAQEFTADRLGAEIAGKSAMASGLRKVGSMGPLFSPYFTQEVAPVLEAGFHPPIADGFSRYLSAPAVSEYAAGLQKQEAEGGASGPYDSHPPMSARIEAIRALSCPEGESGSSPATSLLSGLAELERDILATISSTPEAAQKLVPVGWDAVPDAVFLPSWNEAVEKYRSFLAEIKTSALADMAQKFPPWHLKLEKTAGTALEAEQGEKLAGMVIGGALIRLLMKRDFRLSAAPGEPVLLSRDGLKLEPFSIVPRLKAGELSAPAWDDLCRDCGIADTALVEA